MRDGKRNWIASVSEPGYDVGCETKVFALRHQLISNKTNTYSVQFKNTPLDYF